jgi:hypothetical protein
VNALCGTAVFGAGVDMATPLGRTPPHQARAQLTGTGAHAVESYLGPTPGAVRPNCPALRLTASTASQGH